MRSEIVIDKFGIDIRVLVVPVLLCAELGAAAFEVWWLVIALAPALMICCLIQWKVVFRPKERTVEVIRQVFGIGEQETYKEGAINHLELGFSDVHGEYDSTRYFHAKLVFNPGVTLPIKLFSSTKISNVVEEVHDLITCFPITVRFSDELLKVKASFDGLDTLRLPPK